MRQKFRKSARVVAAAAALTLATGVGGAATASAAEFESTPSMPNTQPLGGGGIDALLLEEGLILEEAPLFDSLPAAGALDFAFPLLDGIVL
ncbi:hypothetical protein [Rhodococcus spongiicola]|uniref:Secreted protein n=1 Tax=Rhodococcus spongiicola TaxID=2487352 RepID=A0A438AUU3_9NOCA|nr:hypothetical protein [Rhodococcus spongiicola]RVW02372.1 hypothetical protein EF834_12295 [Rhodococcus spongiicola]